MLPRERKERQVIALSGENWPNVAEAAARSGKTDRHIRRLCESGKLDHRKDGKSYLIDPASLEQLVSETSSPKDSKSAKDRSESLTSSVAGSDTEPVEDTRPPADKDRTSDILPTDIKALSHQLQTSIQTVRTSQETMSEVTGQLLQRLHFEYVRNRGIEQGLQSMIAELNILPGIQSRRSRALNQFKKILPWILFSLSTGAALLLLL